MAVTLSEAAARHINKYISKRGKGIGVRLVIDSVSMQYLMGAEIDYEDSLEGSRFVIRNPNATSTCGCGSSFSV